MKPLVALTMSYTGDLEKTEKEESTKTQQRLDREHARENCSTNYTSQGPIYKTLRVSLQMRTLVLNCIGQERTAKMKTILNEESLLSRSRFVSSTHEEESSL